MDTASPKYYEHPESGQLNLLFLIRSLDPGGAERQLIILAKGLVQKGYTITIVVFYSGGMLLEELKDSGVCVISLGKKSRWDIFAFILSWLKTVKQVKPQIIHGYDGIPNCLALLAKVFNRSIKIVWGVRASDMDFSKYDWLARFAYKVEIFLSKYADLIIANSNAGAEHAVKNGFPFESMQVIYNGIDTERFFPDLNGRQLLRRQWGILDDEILIGRVGRIDPMKDYPLFISTIAHLVSIGYKVRAVCVGNGCSDYESKMQTKSLNAGLKDVLFWEPARQDVSRIMNALDILVSSSSFGEGFPNVIAEAMACGKPCAVTDVGDSAIIVGDCGMVVAAKNRQALADSLCTIIHNFGKKRTHYSRCARDQIVNNFSVEKLINKSERLVRALV